MALSNPGINLILGPMILGIIINTAMYGIVFTQAITYYTSSGYKKILGSSMILLVWEYCITHFGDEAFLQTRIGSYPNFPGMEGQTTVQITVEFGVLSTLSLTSGVMAFTTAIRALQAANIKVECYSMRRPMFSERMAPLQNFAPLIPFVDTWLALSVVCDLSLTYILSMHPPFPVVDITGTISGHYCSYTCAEVALDSSMLDLITFTLLSNTNFHFVFALLSGRMYTNTLLATLNFRTKLREDMGGVHTIPTAMHGPQVHVSVEQNQEVDIALEGYPRGRKSIGIPAVSKGVKHLCTKIGKARL
ncbi:hypothetical protein B0H14DRAFT_3165236 [Mycena olivaceomarginata]|nr:hypothetical protein B0H14DRAFT_3165236 [Mycena olivaceomarginata]